MTKIKLADSGARQIRFLTNDLDYIDGRPVFSSNGKYLVFMRQTKEPNSISTLYKVDTDGESAPIVLFNGINPLTQLQFNATRPDFSWKRKHYQIAFDALEAGIWLLDIKTLKTIQVLQSNINGLNHIWSYPAWYPDGEHLAITDYNNYSTETNQYHHLVKVNVNEPNQFSILTNNQLVWPGMSSVSQKHSKNLTFAGQLPVTPQPPANPCQCVNGGACQADGYSQNCNQIWLQSNQQDPFPIDQSQGRAPWFSPNGKYIVFESNRLNPKLFNSYRLFIYSVEKQTVEVLTPNALNVQHGKWSPNSKQIAFAVELFGGAQGIAIIDIE